MKKSIRDDLVYLSIGLTVAGLVVFDFFYTDSHGQQMWWPSHFWFHLVGYLLLLEYFVGRETRKVGAPLFQILGCLLAAGVLHTGIAFALRDLYSGPLTLFLFASVILEVFIIVQLAVWTVRHRRIGGV